MPLTLNVGITKKIGLPDYGSRVSQLRAELAASRRQSVGDELPKETLAEAA